MTREMRDWRYSREWSPPRRPGPVAAHRAEGHPWLPLMGGAGQRPLLHPAFLEGVGRQPVAAVRCGFDLAVELGFHQGGGNGGLFDVGELIGDLPGEDGSADGRGDGAVDRATFAGTGPGKGGGAGGGRG